MDRIFNFAIKSFIPFESKLKKYFRFSNRMSDTDVKLIYHNLFTNQKNDCRREAFFCVKGKNTSAICLFVNPIILNPFYSFRIRSWYWLVRPYYLLHSVYQPIERKFTEHCLQFSSRKKPLRQSWKDERTNERTLPFCEIPLEKNSLG